MKKYSKNIVPFIVISLAYLFVVVLFSLQYEHPLKHLCLFKNMTGLPCPGCGLTRSYWAFLRGHLDLAFFYHPLFFTVPFILLIILLLNVQFKPLYKKVFDQILYLFLGIYLLVYLIRLFLYFPHTAPMDFNSEGLIPKAIHLITEERP